MHVFVLVVECMKQKGKQLLKITPLRKYFLDKFLISVIEIYKVTTY